MRISDWSSDVCSSDLETFGAKFIIYPDTYHYMSANHHWLNSWLIFFSRSLFGDSEFSFRLPNLIAHAFYLFFTARLMLNLRKDYFALAGFIQIGRAYCRERVCLSV